MKELPLPCLRTGLSSSDVYEYFYFLPIHLLASEPLGIQRSPAVVRTSIRHPWTRVLHSEIFPPSNVLPSPLRAPLLLEGKMRSPSCLQPETGGDLNFQKRIQVHTSGPTMDDISCRRTSGGHRAVRSWLAAWPGRPPQGAASELILHVMASSLPFPEFLASLTAHTFR